MIEDQLLTSYARSRVGSSSGAWVMREPGVWVALVVRYSDGRVHAIAKRTYPKDDVHFESLNALVDAMLVACGFSAGAERRAIWSEDEIRWIVRDETARRQPQRCRATDRGFICTEDKGHAGMHVARAPDDGVVHTWRS